MMEIQKRTGQFESFDGTQIYYEVRGKGKPLVFCYGIGCLFNHWRHQVHHFSRSHTTILFDYRAHHKSELPKDLSTLTIEALAKDIDRLCKHLQITSASFIGHSFGAQVVAKTFDLFPEYFNNIVFINGFVSNPLHKMFGGDMSAKVFDSIRRGHELLPEALAFAFKKAVTNPVAIPLAAMAGGFNLSLTSFKDIEVYSKGLSSLDFNAFLTLFDAMMKYDGTDVLPRIKVPTLIIGGKKDSVTPVRHQVAMHHMIKKSQLTLITYGSHCTQLDLPDYVNLRMDKFFKEIQYL